jgi:RNA polymerase sigma factor FliA
MSVETTPKAVELKDLWRQYCEFGDEDARARLVVAYSPLAKYVAGRMITALPAHVELADLISYGLVGLISTIERFEPERGIKFETYAIPRIRGAIIDELRRLDWVPRSVRVRARDIERANAKLERQLQRPPSDDEMASELDLTVDKFQAALVQISNSKLVALDEPWASGDGSGEEVSLLDTVEDSGSPDPVALAEAAALKDQMADAIGRLPEREKLVVGLYYYENLTLREIGDVMEVTESRVSQLHTKAVLRMRSYMSEEDLVESG